MAGSKISRLESEIKIVSTEELKRKQCIFATKNAIKLY